MSKRKAEETFQLFHVNSVESPTSPLDATNNNNINMICNITFLFYFTKCIIITTLLGTGAIIHFRFITLLFYILEQHKHNKLFMLMLL